MIQVKVVALVAKRAIPYRMIISTVLLVVYHVKYLVVLVALMRIGVSSVIQVLILSYMTMFASK